MDAIKYFSERFGMGLYITLNKPFAVLQGAFERGGLAAGNLVYLDSITNTPERTTESCQFLGRMRELTDLCIALAKMISEKEVKFVFVDSVSTLLIYNDSKSVARFCHSVTEKLRSLGLPAALVLVEMEEGRDVAAQLAQFCDTYVQASD
jgi:archaellum biogenesis ATPase FlaH